MLLEGLELTWRSWIRAS